jgi:alpha-D-ribose 1-methylphosphonate 5-triphosphate diphosphatase PhnM
VVDLEAVKEVVVVGEALAEAPADWGAAVVAREAGEGLVVGAEELVVAGA